MDAQRWRRVEELYFAALERAVEERGEFLIAVCGADDELRRDVQTLLSKSQEAILDRPPAWELLQSEALAPGVQMGRI